MPLQRLIATHREELIERAMAKVARRPAPPPGKEMEHRVPIFIFLSHLAGALRDAARLARTEDDPGEAEPASTEIVPRSFRPHGQDLSKLGFTIEQVAADFSDACRAVTELALEQHAGITVAVFHTLDRCLDSAIAGAVLSWNEPAPSRGLSSTAVLESVVR